MKSTEQRCHTIESQDYGHIEEKNHIFQECNALQLGKGTCDLIINGVQGSMFYYPYKALETVSGAPEYPDLLMASVKDIACMKMTAIAQRGAKKDFYDLYEILQEEKYSPDDLLDMLHEKFGADENILNTMIMGLSYFDDAEKQQMKKVFMNADWAVIKRASIRLAEELEACCLLKYREDENAPTGRQGI